MTRKTKGILLNIASICLVVIAMTLVLAGCGNGVSLGFQVSVVAIGVPFIALLINSIVSWAHVPEGGGG